MKTRGFADVRRAKKYPSVHTQNQAIKATHFLAWGQAGHDAPSDRQWGMHCATRLDNQIGTLPPSHPRCREATRAQKGAITTQTHNQGCNFEEKCTKVALLPPSCTRALYMRFRRKMGLEKNHLAKIHFQLAKAQEMLKCELDARKESKVRVEKMKKLKDEQLETRKKLAKANRTKKRLEKTLKKFKTKKTAPSRQRRRLPSRRRRRRRRSRSSRRRRRPPSARKSKGPAAAGKLSFSRLAWPSRSSVSRSDIVQEPPIVFRLSQVGIRSLDTNLVRSNVVVLGVNTNT